MSLPNFTAEEWLHDKRGDWAIVRCDRGLPRDMLLETFKRSIIDGEEYEVKGVESFAIMSYSPGTKMGLLVEKRR